jgi:hypothetical protein
MSVKFKDISYNLIKGLRAALSGFVFQEIDEITLIGASGTATILNNGVSKTATYATSLTITALNFVSANASAYLTAGSILTSDGAKLIFKSSVPGVPFTGVTSITNATLTLAGTVTANDTTYPVYKSIPKTPAPVYVWIGGVEMIVSGTKDSFHYEGTVQVQVIDESKMRADKELVQDIMNVIRGILKPTRASVFSISPDTLIVFNPESSNELTEQSDAGITKIKVIDIYNFLIE